MAADFGNSAGQLFMAILTPYDTESGLIMNSALAKPPVHPLLLILRNSRLTQTHYLLM